MSGYSIRDWNSWIAKKPHERGNFSAEQWEKYWCEKHYIHDGDGHHGGTRGDGGDGGHKPRGDKGDGPRAQCIVHFHVEKPKNEHYGHEDHEPHGYGEGGQQNLLEFLRRRNKILQEDPRATPHPIKQVIGHVTGSHVTGLPLLMLT